MTKRRKTPSVSTKRADSNPAPPVTSKGTITAINLPGDILELLRIVAVKRARGGGRPSVSAVLVDLVEKHRDELESEAAPDERGRRKD